jgi:hypothetical protein
MANPEPPAMLIGKQEVAAHCVDPKEIDVALRRYDVVFRYLATEHVMSWTKNQFFLAANAGLFAFASARFPRDMHWTSLLVPAITTMIGMFFSILCLSTLRRAAIHVDRWKAICLRLEPTAFGPHDVLRNVPSTGMRVVTRTIAGVFIVVWSVALALVTALLVRGLLS